MLSDVSSHHYLPAVVSHVYRLSYVTAVCCRSIENCVVLLFLLQCPHLSVWAVLQQQLSRRVSLNGR